jgi:hypothetical protein
MTKLCSLLLVLGTAGVAFAQPAPDQPAPPPTTPDPTPPPITAPPSQPPVVVDPGPHHMDMGMGPERPDEFSIAVGLGYLLPTSLETPNITSVRFRLPNGLTFEPRVVFANASKDHDDGTITTTAKDTEFGLGSLVRFPLIKHGRVDFELLGALDFDTFKHDPDTDVDNDAVTTTTLALSWGVAVNYWISHHWSFSLSATNPLVSYQKVTTQGAAADTTDTNTSFGLEFTPTVFMMIHLYN